MGYNTFTNKGSAKDVITIVYQNIPAQVEGRHERQNRDCILFAQEEIMV